MERILYWSVLLIIFFPSFLKNEAWIIERSIISIFFLISVFFIRKRKLALGKADLFIAVFLFIQIIYSLFSINVYESFYTVFWYLQLYTGSIILRNSRISWFRKKTIRLHFFLDFLIIADYFEFQFYISEFLKYGFLSSRGSLSDSSLWFVNGNMLGNMLLFIGVPGVIYAGRLKRLYLYNIFHAFCIFLTGNFSALFIYISMHVFNIARKARLRQFLIISAIIAGFIFTVFLLTSNDINSSLYHRKILFRISWEQFLENPLTGVSPGLFRYNYFRFFDKVLDMKRFDYLPPSHYVHNDYLQLLCENGLAGFFMIAVLFLFSIKISSKNLIYYFFALILLGFIQHPLYSEKAFFIFILLISGYKTKVMKKTDVSHIKVTSVSLSVFFIIMLIGSLGFEYAEKGKSLEFFSYLRPGYSFILTNTALAYEREHNDEKAEYYYMKAIKYDKFWGENYFRYGRFLIKRGKVREGLDLFRNAMKYNRFRRKFEIGQEGLFFAYRYKIENQIEWFYEQTEKNIFFDDQRIHFESIKKILK